MKEEVTAYRKQQKEWGFLIVSGYFRLWVRVWVNRDYQQWCTRKGGGVCGGTVGSLPHVERPKGADNPAAAGAPNKIAGQKPAFLFGASYATRTRDLLITKGTQTLQMAMKGHLHPFPLPFHILSGASCLTDSIRRFPRMGQGVGQRRHEK